MNPRNAWPVVALTSVATAAVIVMAILHVDKDTVITVTGVLVLPVLASLLAAQGSANASNLQAVKEQTNGNQARLMDLLDRATHLLAAAPAVPAGTTDPTHPTDGGS